MDVRGQHLASAHRARYGTSRWCLGRRRPPGRPGADQQSRAGSNIDESTSAVGAVELEQHATAWIPPRSTAALGPRPTAQQRDLPSSKAVTLRHDREVRSCDSREDPCRRHRDRGRGLAYDRGRAEMSKSADRPSAVHSRVGQPCPACGDTVRTVEYRRYTISYCATCQTNGKALADNTTSKFLK